jgi:3-phosphoshikimate 1-carboxyvinyltransferase
MTTLCLTPTNLIGNVEVPSSKSMGHRELICAALAEGQSQVSNVSMSKDIAATIKGMQTLGAKIERMPSDNARATFVVHGTKPEALKSTIDCGESGSTLRFLIPLAAICHRPITFIGQGKLPTRPLDPYFAIFKQQGLSYSKIKKDNLPLSITGPLHSGKFTVPGNVSSQFISGLLFTLPLLDGASTLEITENLESQSYIAMTLAALKKYGIIIEAENPKLYHIPGSQKYKPQKAAVEGDYSQAAFWLVAGALGGKLAIGGMEQDSLQGDKAVLPIMKQMGSSFTIAGKTITIDKSTTHGVTIDARDCPDLVPVLTVLAAVSQGHTQIVNAGRLRIKECDRLKAISTELNKIGAHITEEPEGLSIDGVDGFTGGKVTSWNDHRIAMSLAVASIKCNKPLIIEGAECVAKSYPDFWQDFAQVGGRYE